MAAILSRYKGYFSYNFYFGPVGKDSMMHVPGIGNFYSFQAICLVLGLVVLIASIVVSLCKKNSFKRLASKVDKRPLIVGVLWLILGPIPASVTADIEHVNRALILFPLVTILIALSVHYVLKKLPYALGAVVLVGFIGLCLWSLKNYEDVYSHSYPAIAASTQFQYGVAQGIEYAVANQASYSKIIVDSEINQPYIYYLFYSRYNPHTLSYAETDVSLVGNQNYNVPQIGKYYFESITNTDLDGAKYLTSINGYGHDFFNIYSNSNDLIMKKEYIPNNDFFLP